MLLIMHAGAKLDDVLINSIELIRLELKQCQVFEYLLIVNLL